jgi:hypothetical protein
MKDLVSVSGLPGLFKVITSKGNGIIVEDLNDGKKQFVSLRAKNNISPLETIAIYTYDNSVPLVDVFINMEKLLKTNPIPDHNGDIEVLKSYFRVILPDFNELKVKNNDIKKVVKWFTFLKTKDLLPKEEESTENKDTTAKEIKTPASEAKKKIIPAARNTQSKIGMANKGANSPKVTKPNKSK